ncbi:MAG: DNA ligase [Candidatus Syntrophonatronum acetioxidans]|uniref:DNA ligase (ATP) n=1 Tax=Candidatus Syntrophonatronum acetioxidans TaxID=1795816 RepID=A0A424YD13_9FIRM|nr:MAG: DNA ligase [Candidatus Syntrophonatronum acetioxidans]
MERDFFQEPLLPMEPFNLRELPPDEGLSFQVKWDGVRILSFVKGSQVRLQNKKLRDRTLQYPELTRLPFLLNFSEGLLDGEMTFLLDNRPRFPAILKRDLALKDLSINYLRKKFPVTYFVFDILFCDGESLLPYPFWKRQEILKEKVREEEFVRIVDNHKEGKRLMERVKRDNLEGVVAKEERSPYLPGKKGGTWWKIKVRKRQLCTIGGFILKKKGLSSLLLGAYQEKDLLYLGRVGTGLKEEEWEMLKGYLQGRTITFSPFINPPSPGKGLFWVEPFLALWVEFSEWTQELKMRAPSIKGFSPSSPRECILS